MQKEITRGLTKIGLLVLLFVIAAVAPAKAQSPVNKLTANIPFDFTVADKKFPAGEYSVSRAQPTAGDLVLQIRSEDGQARIARLTFPVSTLTPKAKGTLVFHRYGDEYFLSEVWSAGSSTGRELPKSRTERELERQTPVVAGLEVMKITGRRIVTIVADLP